VDAATTQPPAATTGPPAVVLLSGGLDSATVLAVAVAEGYRCHALSFRYGQRHAVELESAAAVASALGAAEHVVIDIDLSRFGGSALTDDIEVPRHESVDDLGEGIPSTYVPARNTVFLSIALAWAEVLGAQDVFIGVNAVDYSGYPDCRPEFVRAFEALANVATAAATEHGRRLRVHAPLIEMSKAEIISQGSALGVDFGLTVSCYDPDADGRACGHCDSCLLRAQGFSRAGVADPTRYRDGVVAWGG
jgi:7-cyano-7-deazaguanine synthase